MSSPTTGQGRRPEVAQVSPAGPWGEPPSRVGRSSPARPARPSASAATRPHQLNHTLCEEAEVAARRAGLREHGVGWGRESLKVVAKLLQLVRRPAAEGLRKTLDSAGSKLLNDRGWHFRNADGFAGPLT